jgi:WD40 repeat protein
LPSIAANRGLEPRRLSGLLRGELDWIVMKALEKDRNRRYETANGLAMDVRRYLADEPVLACPPSAGYRLRKFARKYRKVLLTAAAFVLVLILGVAMQTVSLMQIDAARRKAQGKEQKTKKALNTLRVGNVANLWFSADGTELFTITAEDRGLRYWDATRSLAPRSRRISNTPVCGVAFHPNGKELVCVGFDRVIRRLDRQLDAEPVVLGMATELLRAAAYAPEGNLLAVVGDSSALLLDPADGRVLSKLGERGRSVLRSLAWFPDGKGLALAGGWRPFRGNPLQGDMSIWSAETREVLQRFQAGEEVVETVACRPNGKYLAAGSGRFLPEADQPHGTVTIWDTTTGTVLHRLRHSFAVRALAFSPDSKVLASAGINQQKPTEAILWNMATGQEILRASGHSRGIISLTFHPDGRRLVTASMDRTIKVWDTVTGMELLTFTEHPRSLTCVHFSADGNLLASADASGTVFIWEGTPQ